MKRVRVQGWEARLSRVLEDARARPYVLGEHDCLRVACSAIAALTGRDLWPELAGYSTRREAVAVVMRYGRSLEDAGTHFLGEPLANMNLAQRGDIACVVDETGEKHLGVVAGRAVACLREQGLTWVRLRDCVCVWGVG